MRYLQLCRTINDIEQVRRSLKPIPEALRFEGVVEALERRGAGAGQKARWGLHNILQEADDCMVRKIKQVVDRVADKVRPTPLAILTARENPQALQCVAPPSFTCSLLLQMRPDIKKFVFHLCWSAEKVPAADVRQCFINHLYSL